MAIHSSILAWEVLQTENSGRLQSMGSPRVGHNLATKQQFLSYRLESVSWLMDKKLIFLTQSWFWRFSSVAVNVRITKYTPTAHWHSRKLSSRFRQPSFTLSFTFSQFCLVFLVMSSSIIFFSSNIWWFIFVSYMNGPFWNTLFQA